MVKKKNIHDVLMSFFFGALCFLFPRRKLMVGRIYVWIYLTRFDGLLLFLFLLSLLFTFFFEVNVMVHVLWG